MVVCCVPSCPNKPRRSYKNYKCSFHRLPSVEPKRTQWLHSLGISEHVFIQNKDFRVCSDHFDSSDYIFGGNVRKLKKIAVPKLRSVQNGESTGQNTLTIVIVRETFIDTKVYRCYQCKYFTKSADSLKNHLLKHRELEVFNCGQNTVEAFSCETCAYSTNLQVCLKEHQQTHSEVKNHFEVNTYNCQCSFQTFSSLVWLKHKCSIPKLTPDPPLNCAQCNYKTRKEHSLKNHAINEHLSDKANHFYTCDRCQYGTYVVSSLDRHIEITHRSEEYKKWFECAQCDYKSKHGHDLKKHIWTEHWKKSVHFCDKCRFKTKYAARLRHHKLKKHTREKSIKWFKCDQCDFKCMFAANVQWHKKSKHQIKFKCGQCEFKTQDFGAFKKHNLFEEHSEVVTLCCHLCDFKTNNAANLEKHINVKHPKAKWFQCGQCHFKRRESAVLNCTKKGSM